MKSILLCLAATLALPLAAQAAPETTYFSSSHISTQVRTSGPDMSRQSSSSLLYTDSAGRLTQFDMVWEEGVMTLTIRQDGAVAWRRAWDEPTSSFSVTRREEQGRIYFLITAGERHLVAEQTADGAWEVRPAGQNRQTVPL